MKIIARSAVRATEKVLVESTLSGIEARAQYHDGKIVGMVLRAWEQSGRQINIILPLKEAGSLLVETGAFMRDTLNNLMKKD